jgi:hypothetical protein
MPPLDGEPNCTLNDKPPAVHVRVYPPWDSGGGRASIPKVEFEVFGEAGDERWFRSLFYRAMGDEVEALLPDIERAARATWRAFVEAMKPREHLSSRHQEGESE